MHPKPSKLTLLMAVAGLGLSLPGIASATAAPRMAASPGSLHEVFGFGEVRVRPPATSSERDEAISRMVALGLAPLPAPPAGMDPSRPETHPGPAVRMLDGHAPSDDSEAPGQVNGSAAGEEGITAAIEGGASEAAASARPGDEAFASADTAADAMANALALVAVVDDPKAGHAPLLPTRAAPEPLHRLTAGRPPRTASDAHVEPWAHPVLTALPDLDLKLCRTDAAPLVSAGAKHAASETRSDIDFDLDLFSDAMHEPFRTSATPMPADAQRGSALPAFELAGVGPAVTTMVDIDIGGIGIGTAPDIDLGRLAEVGPLPEVDIDLELPAVRPAAAAELVHSATLSDTDAAADAAADTAAATDADTAADAEPVTRGAAVLGIALAEAVSEAKLDRVRGGFLGAGGLEVSFGIERAVYVNGTLVTTTSLNVSGLGNAAGAQPIASTAPAGIALVQNGAGNTFLTGSVNAATLGTVVQNTLNNQKIQTVTLINATVNSLQVVKSMNIGASLRGALIDSLRR